VAQSGGHAVPVCAISRPDLVDVYVGEFCAVCRSGACSVHQSMGTIRVASSNEVPATAALDGGGGAEVEPVSCTSAGNCSAGGGYTDVNGHFQVFVVSEI
jgi:hypothetical protein